MVPEAAVHGYDGRTGRIWTLDWEALIDLAIQAGIDGEG